MSSRRCGLILATACLVLAACTSTVVEEQAAPPPPSVPEELSELDLERFPEDAESPEFGDERDAVLNVSSECRNGADTEAFGVPWFLANELLPEGLEGVETLNGVLRFESFEISTFEGEGYSVQMTFLMEIEDSCTLWPGSDGAIDLLGVQSGPYLSLDLAEAGELAEENGLAWRVLLLDGEPQLRESSLIPDRINFVVEDGIVVGVLTCQELVDRSSGG